MKKVVSVLFILALCVTISSCNSHKNLESDDKYQEGIARGKTDIFIDLWNASSDVSYLHFGDPWTTEHFSVLVNVVEKTIEGETADYLELDLTLNGTTIEECAVNDEMLFNIYSVNDGHWFEVLGYDDYYTYTALNQLDGSSGSGYVRLYDDVQFLVAIVVIDSHIYTARFYNTEP